MTYWRMDGCLVHNKRYINDTSSCATSRRIFQPKSKEQGAILFILELFELFYNESMLNLWMCVNLQMRSSCGVATWVHAKQSQHMISKHSCGEWNHLQLICLLERMYFWYAWRYLFVFFMHLYRLWKYNKWPHWSGNWRHTLVSVLNCLSLFCLIDMCCSLIGCMCGALFWLELFGLLDLFEFCKYF